MARTPHPMIVVLAGEPDVEARAQALATMAHAGQVDLAGQPYIGHPARVAARCSSSSARIVAWLHDVVEDTPVTLDEVEALFGPEIRAAVDALTIRRPRRGEPGAKEGLAEYLARVKVNPIALEVKRADIADNSVPARCAALKDCTRRWLERKHARMLALLDAP